MNSKVVTSYHVFKGLILTLKVWIRAWGYGYK